MTPKWFEMLMQSDRVMEYVGIGLQISTMNSRKIGFINISNFDFALMPGDVIVKQTDIGWCFKADSLTGTKSMFVAVGYNARGLSLSIKCKVLRHVWAPSFEDIWLDKNMLIPHQLWYAENKPAALGPKPMFLTAPHPPKKSRQRSEGNMNWARPLPLP